MRTKIPDVIDAYIQASNSRDADRFGTAGKPETEHLKSGSPRHMLLTSARPTIRSLEIPAGDAIGVKCSPLQVSRAGSEVVSHGICSAVERVCAPWCAILLKPSRGPSKAATFSGRT